MKNIKQSIYPVHIKNDFSLELFIHSNNVANISKTIASCMQLNNGEIKKTMKLIRIFLGKQGCNE